MNRLAPIIGALLLVAGSASGQDVPRLEAATIAYRALEFDRAERLLRALVDDPGGATTRTLADAYVLLGTIRYVRGDEPSARQNYVAALGLQPGARPDPVDASPKVLEFFETVRTSYGAESTGPPSSEVRYLRIEDPRPAAAMRSLVLPGWGQLYKKQRRKGFVLVGAWAAGAGGTLVAHSATRQARDRYEQENNAALVGARFDTFNRRHKLRNAVALGAAGVWLYAYVDAISVRSPERISPRRTMSIAPAYGWDGPGGAIRIRF